MRAVKAIKFVLWNLWYVWCAIICTACATTDPILNKALNESIVFVDKKYGADTGLLEATVFKPDGPGPFPLVIINHGKDYGHPKLQTRSRYISASREFVRHGYVVIIPMRSGFSRSSGQYHDFVCRIVDSAYEQANDIAVALDYAVKLPYVDPQRILVLGHSLGGLATLAFGTRAYPGVRGLVNFSGGLKQPACDLWKENLVQAVSEYGRKSRYPSLWFYGDNDALWSSSIVRAMYSAYTARGGKAKLIQFGVFQENAHFLLVRQDGVSIWWPKMEKFLAALNFPVKHLPIDGYRSELAPVLSAGRLSIVQAYENCRRQYELFIDADYPRVFASSGFGDCAYAHGGKDPLGEAIALCQKNSSRSCRAYVINDDFVWSNESIGENIEALNAPNFFRDLAD